MKKTRISLVIISLLLVCAMAVNLTGCTMKVQAKDLMEGITPNNVDALDDLLVSYLIDLSVSQSSTLLLLHSTHGYQAC